MITYIYNDQEYSTLEDALKARNISFNSAHPSSESLAFFGITEKVVPDVVPEIPLEAQKDSLLNELSYQFDRVRDSKGRATTHLGFDIDATDKSKTDISSLMLMYADMPTDTPIQFMDADNVLRDVTLEDLKKFQLAVIQAGLALYQKKWALRAKIQEASTKEELEALSAEVYSFN